MKGILLVMLVLVMSLPIQAQSLEGRELASQPTTLAMVMSSSQLYYPSILSAQAEISSKEYLYEAAQGTFDPRIEGDVGGRLSGYYSGRSASAEVLQNLPVMGAKVFAGYRITDGSLPVYQSGESTLNGGEMRFGVSLSLMRNRLIDDGRAKLQSTQLDVLAKSHEYTAQRIAVLQGAYISYSRWLLAARLLESYEALLDIAIKRGEALEQRVSSGDAAEILLVENDQAVLQRRGLAIGAKRELQIAAETLALYFRNESGEPMLPFYDPALSLPDEDDALLARPIQELLSFVIERRPEIGLLEVARSQAKLDEQLADNLRKPKVDVQLYNRRDFGTGPANLVGSENMAGISFSVPLRTREANGKSASARAQVQSLDLDLRMATDRLRTNIRQALVNLDATRELEEVAVAEYQVSETLAQAERQRFDEGLSDFFLLNVRERQVGEAQLKRLQAHLSHQIALADFYAATMAETSFGVEG